MRTKYETLLSLFEWGSIMGIDPYELGQVGTGFPANNQAQCAHVFFQYQWQQDYLSRDEVGLAIQKAEQEIATYLTYWPAPKYFVAEPHVFPRPIERYLYGAGTTKRFQTKAVQLNWAKVQGGGIFARTPIQASAAVVYADKDGDGVNDLFTVTVPTSITDISQIAIYYTTADRNGVAIDETWRIRPVNVAISGGNAVITGHPSLCVVPNKETIYGAQVLSVTDVANFITGVDVYQVYTDNSTSISQPSQGVAEWEAFPDDCAIPPCDVELWPVCLSARNVEGALVGVDYWLSGQNTPTQFREPDRVEVNYLAGVTRQLNGLMDATMANAVAHLATALLPVDKCGCERSSRIVHYWRSYPTDGEQTRPIAPEEITENPFSTQAMGALFAWRLLREFYRMPAVFTR